eukprot:scaffold115326_cov27-Phaeocystis_antarctica.AAC.1
MAGTDLPDAVPHLLKFERRLRFCRPPARHRLSSVCAWAVGRTAEAAGRRDSSRLRPCERSRVGARACPSTPVAAHPLAPSARPPWGLS